MYKANIPHASGVIDRFLANLGKEHWVAVKWMLKYLRETFKVSICFTEGKSILIGYTDIDMTEDIDSWNFTFSYLIIFAEGAVS